MAIGRTRKRERVASAFAGANEIHSYLRRGGGIPARGGGWGLGDPPPTNYRELPPTPLSLNNT